MLRKFPSLRLVSHFHCNFRRNFLSASKKAVRKVTLNGEPIVEKFAMKCKKQPGTTCENQNDYFQSAVLFVFVFFCFVFLFFFFGCWLCLEPGGSTVPFRGWKHQFNSDFECFYFYLFIYIFFCVCVFLAFQHFFFSGNCAFVDAPEAMILSNILCAQKYILSPVSRSDLLFLTNMTAVSYRNSHILVSEKEIASSLLVLHLYAKYSVLAGNNLLYQTHFLSYFVQKKRIHQNNSTVVISVRLWLARFNFNKCQVIPGCVSFSVEIASGFSSTSTWVHWFFALVSFVAASTRLLNFFRFACHEKANIYLYVIQSKYTRTQEQ